MIFPIVGVNNPFFKLKSQLKVIPEENATILWILSWASSCNDATFRLLPYLSKYIFSPLFLVDRKTSTFESAILAIKLCMHWTCPDHPNYTELLSLFILLYYRAPQISEGVYSRVLIQKTDIGW